MPVPEYHLFAFTINNYSDDDITWLEKTYKKHCSWMIYGAEIAPTTGTPHLQGALWTTQPKRTANIRRMFKKHWASYVTSEEKGPDYWVTYCSKEDTTPTEFGERPTHEEYLESTCHSGQGKRTDLTAFVEFVEHTKPTKKTLVKEFTPILARYPKFVDTVIDVFHPEVTKPEFSPRWPLQDLSKPLLFLGPPGCGKTEYALAHFPEGCLFVRHMDDLGHFNPDHHHGIVFDDMSFRHLPRTANIHLVDFAHASSIHIRYKTAKIPARTPRIFTANEYPFCDEAFPDDAIRRRFTKVEEIFFSQPNE